MLWIAGWGQKLLSLYMRSRPRISELAVPHLMGREVSSTMYHSAVLFTVPLTQHRSPGCVFRRLQQMHQFGSFVIRFIPLMLHFSDMSANNTRTYGQL